MIRSFEYYQKLTKERGKPVRNFDRYLRTPEIVAESIIVNFYLPGNNQWAFLFWTRNEFEDFHEYDHLAFHALDILIEKYHCPVSRIPVKSFDELVDLLKKVNVKWLMNMEAYGREDKIHLLDGDFSQSPEDARREMIAINRESRYEY